MSKGFLAAVAFVAGLLLACAASAQNSPATSASTPAMRRSSGSAS